MFLVFIVDDDLLYSKVLERQLLQNPDLNVQIFQSAEECIKNLHFNPDIITIDYQLEGKNGLELLKRVKDYNEYILPIVISGQHDVHVVVDAYKNGAKDYIIKGDNTLV